MIWGGILISLTLGIGGAIALLRWVQGDQPDCLERHCDLIRGEG